MDYQSNWLLGCPAPQHGRIEKGYYNAGPMAADDRIGPTEEDSRIQIVSGITEDDYEQYIRTLKASGNTGYLENRIGADRFFAFEKSGKNHHIRYCAKRGEIRVVEEPAFVSPRKFGYRADAQTQATVYQYGLYYDPGHRMTPKTANCGMLYIIHLCDNSLFMVDGGFILQWNEEAIKELWQFLRKITNTPEKGTVRICAWYFTHTHADHIDGCVKLLNRYHENILLERLLFNFPLYSAIGGYEPSGYYVKEIAAKWYPHVKYLKLHTGQNFDLADVNVEVFYTQEDTVTPDDMSRFPLRDSNCASSILKLTIGGKTLMLLGDTNVETEEWLTQYSERATWKSDMVQVAHHCINYLDTLYEWIAAPVALVPNSWGGANQPQNKPKLAAVLKHIQDDQVYYAGGGTDGFVAAADGWKHTAHYPLQGGEYDGSGY